MDWQQVVLNGGPPCFAVLDDEEGWYCGRAERWEGHDGEHRFISLSDLLTSAHTEGVKEGFSDAVGRAAQAIESFKTGGASPETVTFYGEALAKQIRALSPAATIGEVENQEVKDA